MWLLAILSKSSHLKDISLVIQNFLCLFSYCAYFIFSDKSEELVTERNKRLNLWSLLINWRTQFFIRADWVIENDLCQTQYVVPEFFAYVLKNVKFKVIFTEAYLEPSRTSMVWWSFFTKIVNDLQPLTLFAKKLLRRRLTGF